MNDTGRVASPVREAADPDAGTADLLRKTAELAIAYREGLATSRVGPTASARDLQRVLGAPLADTGEDPEAIIETLARVVPAGLMRVAGPRFFGFVVGGSLPVTVAADWLTSAWDQNAALALLAPAAAGVEAVLAEWLVDLLGLPAGTSLGLTSGASMASFTGLAAGRDAVLRRIGWDVEADGLQGAPKVTVVVSDDVHVTVLAALRMLGLGSVAPLRVAVDEQGRIRPAALRETLRHVAGPLIVSLQAGNVNSGAFDPLAEAIAIVREHDNTWLHIDGAFGLWAAASPTQRHQIAGHELADSWSADAHKWLNVPYDCGLIFVRDAEAHRTAMSLTASYLTPAESVPDPSDFVPELSRRARGFTVYAALRFLGRNGLAELVDRCCALARQFAAALGTEPGVSILNDVVLNQVLVRFDDSDDRTQDVIARVQADGTAWFGGGLWQGRRVMRISVSNWWTREADVDRSVEAIRRALRASRTAG